MNTSLLPGRGVALFFLGFISLLATTPTLAQPSPASTEPKARAIQSKGAFGIPYFSATYALQKFGITGATIKVRFAPKGKYLIYSQTTQAAGLLRLFRHDTIQAESVMPKNRPIPLPKVYRFSDTGGGHNAHAIVHFDRKTLIATGHITNGNAIHVKIDPSTLDRLSLQLALMQAVAHRRHPLNFTTVETWNKLSHYHFKLTGKESIHTPLGTINTVVIERTWKKKKTRFVFWLAPKLHYLPVKLEQIKDNNSPIVMMLQSVHWF